MKIQYIKWNPRGESVELIDFCNGVISDYQAQGFSLTLRQLYYQLVARDMIPNSERSYKRIAKMVSNGRKSGLISWLAIEDRTRNLQSYTKWDNPKQIVSAAINSYTIDKWENQFKRVEVWVEKEALIGIVAAACEPLQVDYFACRGFASDSETWAAAQRLEKYRKGGQDPIVIHLGDHDPSGIDMSRDIQDRLELFEAKVDFHRIALNMDQIERYGPPPNPAKTTDSRFKSYRKKYGSESWELDALNPTTLSGLITETVLQFRDESLWSESLLKEDAHIKELKTMIG